MEDLHILVNSCDAYSDLWKNHFDLFFKHWKGTRFPITLITDKPTNIQLEGVDIVVVEDNSFAKRIHNICKNIKEKYVLVTLDDYYLIDDANYEDFAKYLSLCEENNIDYLSIYNRRYTKKKQYTAIGNIKSIDLNNEYAINLYPAIWKKDFLLFCSDFSGSPWEFEPNLTKSAKEYQANCFYNLHGSFNILDVIRKGKLLRKARKYLKKNGYSLPNRENLPFRMELKQTIADFIFWHMPKKIYNGIRKIAIAFGMKSYSQKKNIDNGKRK